MIIIIISLILIDFILYIIFQKRNENSQKTFLNTVNLSPQNQTIHYFSFTKMVETCELTPNNQTIFQIEIAWKSEGLIAVHLQMIFYSLFSDSVWFPLFYLYSAVWTEFYLLQYIKDCAGQSNQYFTAITDSASFPCSGSFLFGFLFFGTMAVLQKCLLPYHQKHFHTLLLYISPLSHFFFGGSFLRLRLILPQTKTSPVLSQSLF